MQAYSSAHRSKSKIFDEHRPQDWATGPFGCTPLWRFMNRFNVTVQAVPFPFISYRERKSFRIELGSRAGRFLVVRPRLGRLLAGDFETGKRLRRGWQ